MPDKFIAMFSVAGEPFECLDECDTHEAAANRCREEETRWRCRVDWFVKVKEKEDA